MIFKCSFIVFLSAKEVWNRPFRRSLQLVNFDYYKDLKTWLTNNSHLSFKLRDHAKPVISSFQEKSHCWTSSITGSKKIVLRKSHIYYSNWGIMQSPSFRPFREKSHCWTSTITHIEKYYHQVKSHLLLKLGDLSYRRDDVNSLISSQKSFHSGFILVINASFFSLRQCFSSFSLAMASTMLKKYS